MCLTPVRHCMFTLDAMYRTARITYSLLIKICLTHMSFPRHFKNRNRLSGGRKAEKSGSPWELDFRWFTAFLVAPQAQHSCQHSNMFSKIHYHIDLTGKEDSLFVIEHPFKSERAGQSCVAGATICLNYKGEWRKRKLLPSLYHGVNRFLTEMQKNSFLSFFLALDVSRKQRLWGRVDIWQTFLQAFFSHDHEVLFWRFLFPSGMSWGSVKKVLFANTWDFHVKLTKRQKENFKDWEIWSAAQVLTMCKWVLAALNNIVINLSLIKYQKSIFFSFE